MKAVVKIINSIWATALQHRLFKCLLDQLDVAYGELLLNTDMSWLSNGRVLQRDLDLLSEIEIILQSRNAGY